jgi:hypothetical protein
MTIEAIKALDREFLTPAEIAPILGCNAQDIRWQARTAPERLGFPVIIIKSRTKIPRRGFIRWMEGEKEG